MLKKKPVPPGTEGLAQEPLWFKDAVIYELRVRSYNDSSGTGTGDLAGLTEKLDYLRDLGINALWLLPICPSPMRDDGYDISDYRDVQQEVGTLDDFKFFVEEAHKRGLRVITELVLNHTSDQHPWFQRARRAPAGSPERDFYVWSDTAEKFRDARIIFKDFETSNWAWDPLAKAYYWHRFYSHQPDLNFRNPAVRQAMLEVVDFWFDLGVDGLRLDAVPYLFESDGTNCENLPETHGFLKTLRAHIDSKFRDRMLLAEANQWPEDAARYFGDGDECHMCFHFPIMPRLFMSIDMEDRFPILDILAQTPSLPESCQWALFLRNHDELTLEMVTDEERDYMYRAYAHDPTMRINLGIRRRLAPLCGNNRRKMELMNGLLASLPGTPVVYYGDEIGMGDNVYLGDRNGVRTPMQWSADRNAGFSRANPQKLILPVNIDPEYHYESLNVEAQQNNTSSLLWWMKRLLALRRRFKAFGRGTLEVLTPQNHRVIAFIRRFEDETILVVANLSRFIQFVELDLSAVKGCIPIELFGHTEFPPIGELPYLLTLGGHAFYWFSLEQRESTVGTRREQAYQPPLIDAPPALDVLLHGVARPRLEAILPEYLQGRRWYESRERELVATRILEAIPLGDGSVELVTLRAEYVEGESEQYLLPVSLERGAAATELNNRAPQAVIARLKERDGSEALLTDALADGRHARDLLQLIASRLRRKERGATLIATAANDVTALREDGSPREVHVMRTERGRVALAFDEQYLIKAVRRLSDGMSPDLEIGRVVSEAGLKAPIPPVIGAIELARDRAEPITLATLYPFVRHKANGWELMKQELSRYYERVLAAQVEWPGIPHESLVELAASGIPEPIELAVGSALELGRLMGVAVAGMHVAFAHANRPSFEPEPYSALDQRSLYQSMRNLAGRVLRQLRSVADHFEAPVAKLAKEILGKSQDLHARFQPLLHVRLTGARIRCHGELRLDKLLFTGKEFVIIDFDGDAKRPLADRRRKRPPLRDVATLLDSYMQVAAHASDELAVVRESDRPEADRWSQLWSRAIGASFLRGYVRDTAGASFLGHGQDELTLLLDLSLLEAALEEVARATQTSGGNSLPALRNLLRAISND